MEPSPTAMVIDPDPGSRADVAAVLRSVGREVVAETGYGVEASSSAAEQQPDLVLAAVEAPTDRALQTLRALRALRPDLRVIVYSSITEIPVFRELLQLGVTDFLARPLEVRDLRDSLDVLRRADTQADHDAETHADADADRTPVDAAGVVLTIVGPKGGTGKSTIATNVAAAIARDSDLSVLVIDLDTRFGDVAIMLDVEPTHTIADLAGHPEAADRDTYRSALTPHPGGVSVLAAPRHPQEWREISPAEVTEVITLGARLFDIVILDTPGTFNDIVATAITSAHRVLLVSSLDLASIKDTAYMLDLLEADGFPADRLLLTVNQVHPLTTLRARDVPALVNHPVHWEIPYDPAVARSAQAGEPVVLRKPRSPGAQQLRGLAQDLTAAAPRPRDEVWATPNRSLLRRVLDRRLFDRRRPSAAAAFGLRDAAAPSPRRAVGRAKTAGVGLAVALAIGASAWTATTLMEGETGAAAAEVRGDLTTHVDPTATSRAAEIPS